MPEESVGIAVVTDGGVVPCCGQVGGRDDEQMPAFAGLNVIMRAERKADGGSGDACLFVQFPEGGDGGMP